MLEKSIRAINQNAYNAANIGIQPREEDQVKIDFFEKPTTFSISRSGQKINGNNFF